MSLIVGGTGVSRGIAMGRARLLHDIEPKASRRVIPKGQVTNEIRRFKRALTGTMDEMAGAERSLGADTPHEVFAFLESYLLMLRDEALSQPVINLIRRYGRTSEWALLRHRDALVGLFDSMEDPYLKARRDDVDNVVQRILRKLSGVPGVGGRSKKKDDTGYILVTGNLAPTDLLLHRNDGLLGVVTRHGSALSHTTIVARSAGIPAVAAVGDAVSLIRNGDTLIIDGDSGMVLASPDARAVDAYKRQQRKQQRRRSRLRKLKDEPAVTTDGWHIELQANIDLPEEITLARRVRAEGIGLFRTESLYLNRQDLPSEQEQFEVYRNVVKRMRGIPVTIRTMDIWSSSRFPGLEAHMPQADQPALGLRAIRLGLKFPEIFLPQLKALLRASAYGPVRILLPMVTNVAEIEQTRVLIENARAELSEEGRRFSPRVPLGVMVETPASAIACQMFANCSDFISIGTNDLAQYTLAIDRTDDSVQPLYDPIHPAVLKLIQGIVRVGHKAHVPVTICGEMAGDPAMTRLLLGLGLRGFSTHPNALLEIKDIIMHADAGKLARRAQRLVRAESPVRALAMLDRMNRA